MAFSSDIFKQLFVAKQVPEAPAIEWPIPDIYFVKNADDLGALEVFGTLDSILIVGDENTYPLIGDTISSLLLDATVESVILPDGVNAEETVAKEIAEKASSFHHIIAIGSGTINDLCKYAAKLSNKHYSVIATAPSMNGYVSSNASLKVDGYHSSVPATLPKNVMVIEDILMNAPKHMIASGYADVMAYHTAKIDWQLSSQLLGTGYRDDVFEWLTPHHEYLAEHATELIASNSDAMRCLMEALLISGLGMVASKGSYPASQAEHMIAHCMHMLFETDSPALHGEEIAVTTLFMLRFMSHLFSKELPKTIAPATFPISGWHDLNIKKSCHEAYKQKVAAIHGNAKFAASLEAYWPKLKAMSAELQTLHDMLLNNYKALGLPTTADELGWNQDDANNAVLMSVFTRNRFTSLDIAHMMGAMTTEAIDAAWHPTHAEE